jgi:uncharacterized protein
MMKVWKPSPQEIAETKGWGIWSKEVSEFPWHYDDTETCYIIEGEAIAFDDQDHKIRFRAGDMVQFERGLSCTWKISKPIRKRYLFG